MAFMRELDFQMGFFLSIWSGPLWASLGLKMGYLRKKDLHRG
ncbi:hypothetical protein NC652_028407 [Populus alba x Populus x berolinensis]|nr:hypothetical protein NC652_028407 [Populus alba x Populus x berolinensis]